METPSRPIRAAARRGLVLFSLASAIPLRAQEPAPLAQRITLGQAIQLALEQGHLAHAALARRDAALSRNAAFSAGLLPQLSLTTDVPGYNRSVIPVVQPDGSTLFRAQDQTNMQLNATVSQILPVTGGQLFVSSSLRRLAVSGQDERTWSSTPVSFGLSQPILRPNTSGWDRREHAVSAELAEREYLDARESIALQTAGLFFDAYAAQVDLETATGNAAVNDTLYTLNQGRFDVGKIGENDLLQSQLALLRSRTRLDGAKLNYQRALAALRLALNLPPGTALGVVAPAQVPAFDADTALAVQQALERRPVVTSTELQDLQARRRVTEAKLSNWPGATLTASYGFNAIAPEPALAYRNLLEARRVTVQLAVPLLQWGAHGENVRAAEAERDGVESTVQATLEQTAHEARFAALQLSQARRNLGLSATGDTVANKRFEVAYNRYLIGRIAMDNLYIAQQEKDQARNQYVGALRGYWEAYYGLRRATLFDFERGEPIR